MSSRSRSIASASSFLVFLLLVLAGASEASAQKRVVVFPFDGRGAADAEDEVVDVVKRDATLVSQSALSRARKRLGVRSINESGIARLSAELQADAFIEGALERRRRGGYTLLLTIHEGKTGAVTDTLAISMRSSRLDSDSKAELAEKLVPALAKIDALSTEEPIDITPPPGPAVAQAGDTEAAPVGDTLPPSDTPEADEEDEDKP